MDRVNAVLLQVQILPLSIDNPLVYAGGLFFFRKVEVVNHATEC